jgi:hypothetical protein
MKQQLSYQMGDGHIVTGEIPVSYDRFVFADIEENIVYKKSNIAVHFDTVMSTVGDSYKGLSKYAYGNTLQAINTIVNCKKTHARRTEICKEAIAFLHQDMQLATTSIQNILQLFGVKLSTMQILRDSEQVLSEKDPMWVHRVLGGLF